MTRALAAIVAVGLGLAGCGATPPPPAWQANAYGALQSAVDAYLAGNTRVAAAEMARARAEIARTGQAALLARAELVMCAAHVASADFDGCPAYQALAADALPAERAYAAYLYGRVPVADLALLPAQHRAVAVSADTTVPPRLEDPLAQLVAAGVLLRSGRLAPQGMEAASETASAQGWRRALLAWLALQAQRADEAGDRDAGQRLRRRMELVTRAGAPG